ncbi:MAG: hypothetical protein P8N56_05985 [Schleiferiaceae bacterium]|nr:hypothetical protein [Schleiferiaceae bacterium]
MLKQPIPSLKVCLLLWSGWPLLTGLPAVGQNSPYFYQSDEVHTRALRLSQIADTNGLRPSERESFLPIEWRIHRQWYDSGEALTVEWFFDDVRDSWMQPLEGIQWGPQGRSYFHRGTWHPAPMMDADLHQGLTPSSLFFPTLIPSPEACIGLSAVEQSPGVYEWTEEAGITHRVQTYPPAWEWIGPDSSVLHWDFIAQPEGWFLVHEERRQPQTLSNGACAWEWTEVHRSLPLGQSGSLDGGMALVLSPNPRREEALYVALDRDLKIQPSQIEVLDLHGRSAWLSTQPPRLPGHLNLQIPPGRYTLRVTAGPYQVSQAFVQL